MSSQLSLAERIAQRVQSATQSPAPVQNDPGSEDDLPATPSVHSSFFSGGGSVHSTALALATFARQLKDDYDLDHTSCADVDKYCSLSLEHRLLLHFVMDVKQREIAKKKDGSHQYTIPVTLKTTLRINAFQLLMSPKLTCYHGKLSKAVIDATREIGCSELPAVHKSGKLQLIEQHLKKYFTDLRYQLKEKIKQSISRKKKRDIASLTVDIIGEKDLSPTLALFRRVALLRAYLAESTKNLKPEDRKKDFWVRVDEGIQKWRNIVNGNAEQLLGFFEETYKEDVEKYGDPARSGVVTVKMSDIPAHQQVIDKHAARVQYSGPGEDDDDHRSRKRKRTDTGYESGHDGENEDVIEALHEEQSAGVSTN
ncbi:hypothetical protein K435DRAFT_789470 [Dendrothele bispora CBS 962.96]|uniref:Uncharacterized protein n=1 Tax=Dendrothele bispora (strain CBS 962.96) TaxID=1314807 RepID=A0A4V4HIF4_DENBC|nr:hypothetical protein K435DRAFT_789470 [Dendrothele bispora CBS 962.96]